MSQIGSNEILFECLKFKQNILKHSGPDPFAALLSKLVSREGSATIMSFSALFPKLGIVPKDPETIIHEASSGKTSELRETAEGAQFEAPKADKINFKYIERLLIDSDTFEEISDMKTQNGPMRTILLLSKIDTNLTFFKFRNFYESLNFIPELLDLRFCFYKHKFSIIFHFNREFEAMKFFSCCERRITNFTKTFGEKYEIQFLKNRSKITQKIEAEKPKQNTRKFIEKILKPAENERKLKYYPEGFVGVIVRNIPENYECRDIVENLKKMKLNAELIEFAIFRDQHFCLIRLESIEAAENACLFLHQRIIGNKMLKCHVHSFSNYERKFIEEKNFKLIFRQRSLDFKKIDEVFFNLDNVGRKRNASFSESDVSKEIDRRVRTHYPQKTRYPRKYSRESEKSYGKNSPRSDLTDQDKRGEYRKPYIKDNGFKQHRDFDRRLSRRNDGPRRDYDPSKGRNGYDYHVYGEHQQRRAGSPPRGPYNPNFDGKGDYTRRPHGEAQSFRERDPGRSKLPEKNEYERRPHTDYSKGRK